MEDLCFAEITNGAVSLTGKSSNGILIALVYVFE